MAKKTTRNDATSGEQLIEAIRVNDLKLVQKLIAAGADVNEIPEEDSPIGVAAEVGNEQIVDALLKAGADAGIGGLSVPLVTASWRGHAKIVRRLLDAGADVNMAEEAGNTALMAAAVNGKQEIVKILIDGDADVNAEDEDGSTALMSATRNKHPKIAKMLLDAGAKPIEEPKQTTAGHNDIEAPDKYGRTRLYNAAFEGDIKHAKELLAAGANIEAADQFGQTPLLSSIRNDAESRAMIKLLAEAGANLHVKDAHGQSVLAKASRYLPPDGLGEEGDQLALRALFVEIGLISESAGKLAIAAGEGDIDAVKKLIETGTKPDATDEQDRTPLWMAISRNHPAVAAFLLQAKADPSKPIGRDDDADIQYGGRMMPCPKCKKPFMSMIWTRTCPACGHSFDVRKTFNDSPTGRPLIFTWVNGWTPLMAAARMNDATLANMLLDAGANIESGRSGTTPLMCACSYENIEMAKLLIDRGAKVNAVCKDTNSRVTEKLTAIDIAGEAGNLELLELLWSAGAKMENKDAARLTAAARAGDVKGIQSLLKAGTDINVIDPFGGNTALYAASVNGRPEALRTLLEAGASITPPKRGMAPLLMTSSSICEGLSRGKKTPDDVPRYVETIKLLIAAGAPVKVAMFGQTPLNFAKEAKCGPLIELFETALAAETPKNKPVAKAKPKKK